jgi:hypothetical protein
MQEVFEGPGGRRYVLRTDEWPRPLVSEQESEAPRTGHISFSYPPDRQLLIDILTELRAIHALLEGARVAG